MCARYQKLNAVMIIFLVGWFASTSVARSDGQIKLWNHVLKIKDDDRLLLFVDGNTYKLPKELSLIPKIFSDDHVFIVVGASGELAHLKQPVEFERNYIRGFQEKETTVRNCLFRDHTKVPDPYFESLRMDQEVAKRDGKEPIKPRFSKEDIRYLENCLVGMFSIVERPTSFEENQNIIEADEEIYISRLLDEPIVGNIKPNMVSGFKLKTQSDEFWRKSKYYRFDPALNALMAPYGNPVPGEYYLVDSILGSDQIHILIDTENNLIKNGPKFVRCNTLYGRSDFVPRNCRVRLVLPSSNVFVMFRSVVCPCAHKFEAINDVVKFIERRVEFTDFVEMNK